jgi:hypothetical protein
MPVKRTYCQGDAAVDTVGNWIFRLLGLGFLGMALWSYAVLSPQMAAEAERVRELPAQSITELRELSNGSEVVISGELVNNPVAESDYIDVRDMVFYRLYECREFRTDEGTQCNWTQVETVTPDLTLRFDGTDITLQDSSIGPLYETERRGSYEIQGYQAGQMLTAHGIRADDDTIQDAKLSSGQRDDLLTVINDRGFASDMFLIGMLMGAGMLFAGFKDQLTAVWHRARGNRYYAA